MNLEMNSFSSWALVDFIEKLGKFSNIIEFSNLI